LNDSIVKELVLHPIEPAFWVL